MKKKKIIGKNEREKERKIKKNTTTKNSNHKNYNPKDIIIVNQTEL